MSELWLEYRDRLAGAWKCISYELYDKPSLLAKLISRPHGNDPMGRVYVSRNRYVAAHLALPDRVQQYSSSSSSDSKDVLPWIKRSDAEIAHVARGLSMYCGYMELFEDDEGLFWKTKVEVASDPTRIGGYQARRVGLAKDENGETIMVLRPMNPIVLENGTRAWAVVKWQKVESA